MALVICPHCGKTVSDTVSVCIHCGKDIKAQEEKLAQFRLYEELNSAEQNTLLNQFSREYPEYTFPHNRERAAKKRKAAKIPWLILSVCCIALFITRVLVGVGVVQFSTEGDDFIIPGLLLLVAVLAILISITIWFICKRKANKLMRQFLLFAKLYQAWLSTKGIKYKLTFRNDEMKYKKYFRNINPDLYRKEA